MSGCVGAVGLQSVAGRRTSPDSARPVGRVFQSNTLYLPSPRNADQSGTLAVDGNLVTVWRSSVHPAQSVGFEGKIRASKSVLSFPEELPWQTEVMFRNATRPLSRLPSCTGRCAIAGRPREGCESKNKRSSQRAKYGPECFQSTELVRCRPARGGPFD